MPAPCNDGGPANAINDYLVVTCEHGGNRIPPPYRYLFTSDEHRTLLESHRGFDAGALVVARAMAKELAAPLVSSTVSRLLVDLNRSLNHRTLHAPHLRNAPEAVRRRIVDRYYRPYRSKAESLMRAGLDQGCRVVHISCHSFTPELDGDIRNADIGLLYHPARPGEVEFCESWQASLKACAPELKVRRNYPYEGRNDGFTAYLRRRYSAFEYVGIELEINQKLVLKSAPRWSKLRASIIASLRPLLRSGIIPAPTLGRSHAA